MRNLKEALVDEKYAKEIFMRIIEVFYRHTDEFPDIMEYALYVKHREIMRNNRNFNGASNQAYNSEVGWRYSG